jgi:hypothetical protein
MMVENESLAALSRLRLTVVCILTLFGRSPDAPATHKATVKIWRASNLSFHGKEW